MLGVSDVWTAFCLDRAVHAFGSVLQSELDGVEGKTAQEITRKRERILRTWLELKQQFRNPSGMVGPKKPDGEV